MTPSDKDDVLFKQKVADKCNRAAQNYSPEFTHFLDGRQKRMALEVCSSYSESIIAVCYGGFDDAERVRVGMFPKDVYGYVTDEKEFFEQFDVSALKIDGSGFSSFGHRDVMGSVLALGIKREVVGDIYLPDDRCAYVCLCDAATGYVLENLDCVARDKVKVKSVPCETLPKAEKKFTVVSGTVASDRLDCIVALCTGLSREKAKQMISSGLVNVNHFEELRCDNPVLEGDVISIRGYGRFVLQEHGGLSKKGRLKTVVHKMI